MSNESREDKPDIKREEEPKKDEPAIGRELADFMAEVWADWARGRPVP